MGRVTVSSYLAAHRGQVPEAVWLARREQWTPEVSARAWAAALAGLADGTDPITCIYLAAGRGARSCGRRGWRMPRRWGG